MTEAKARTALAASDAVGGLERWIAAQPWLAASGGWVVPGDLQGWRFRVEPAPGGVRVSASMGRGERAAKERAQLIDALQPWWRRLLPRPR